MSDLELDTEPPSEEDAPLLDDYERADEPLPARPRIRAKRWQVKTPGAIVLLAATLKFCITSSGMLMLIPLYRLIEDAVCHAWYEDDGPDIIEEMKCKGDEVQSRLAFMLGWFGLFNSIMTLLVAFPYGMLADRIGRKPTAIMAYGSVAVSFGFAPLMLNVFRKQVRENPYVLMTGSLFLLFGGGVPVLLNTLYAMAADVSTEKEKAASFLYLTFGATAGGLIGPLLAGLLMEKYGPWVPIYVVLFVTPFMLCVFFFIPETLVMEESKTKPKKNRPLLEDLQEHISHGLRDLRKSLDMIKNVNIPLVLLTFLFQSARFAAYTGTLAQYISKHFGWRLAETSLLLSPLGVLNLIVLAGLPRVSQVLMSPRFRFSIFGKDLFLTQVSTALIIVGALIEGFSHNVVLFLIGLFIGTFGAADSPLARATVTHYVDAEFTSRLYALIGMIEVLGSFIGGPVLAFFFDQGLRRKGIWMGLPWFYIAFLCCIALAALMFVRPPRRKLDGEDGASVNGSSSAGHLHPE
ncbi:siderophore iron transporter mirB [Purpureocillium lavendulum]|uniref:Siderophore iron transporter mirB n=1 Tax=Purpureocillium lavendulum TaxID=1247861 RepID=A0AB34FGY1_9HYPO|nr:siderophore iron transporter mirB [Purpureocillium lavendulum]